MVNLLSDPMNRTRIQMIRSARGQVECDRLVSTLAVVLSFILLDVDCHRILVRSGADRDYKISL